MNIGDTVKYNGHRLDGKEHGDTDLTRRIEPGTVTKLLPNNWVEVTLESGIKVAMSENDMKIACGVN